ncbi:histidine phosphatase family protein [Halioglobus maricola]|uniref:Histidine phosphatase family protein n=1 Tax=Halioglobus maricola TaxID=2601894 RepID=A0A5P9NM19_9GAMM|nr:histidine phosphatase family protein [Halioglobus maricola]QFU76304.1 histidine phosphatase family protein [Halioglobus maricola]
MDIYLVRHGEAATDWGKSSDPGLSELGREQARDTATDLLTLLPDNVSLLSSPLLRARETAQALAELMDKPVVVDDTYREIPARVALTERKAWLGAFMAGEWSDQPDYLIAWRDALHQELALLPNTTVIFSHFLAINAIVGKLTDRSETVCFYPDNASVTHFKISNGQLELASLGQQMQTVVN